MFLNFLSSLADFAFATPILMARFQARLALDAGEYGKAADHYILAEHRLGNRLLAPLGCQTLFPDNLRECAKAAIRVAVEERRPIKSKLRFRDVEPPKEVELKRLICFRNGGYGLEEPIGLTPSERLLLVLHQPLEAAQLLSDLGARYLFSPYYPSNRFDDDRGIRRLFYIRRLAALAEQGDREALYDLAQAAIHSNTALHALDRLEAAGIAEAYEHRAMVDHERHTMFLAAQQREQQRLEDEIRSAYFMIGGPH